MSASLSLGPLLNDVPGAAQAPPAPDAQGPTIDAYPGDEADLLPMLIRYYEDSEMASVDERDMAEKCRDYYDGAQITPTEMAILKRRRQPPVINNYVKRKIELLRGLERRGRSDPKAYPRTPNEENRADIATQVLRYIADDQRFDVIRSSVFDNIMIEGMGGAEVIVEPDRVDGGYNVIVNHIPWNRIFRDPHSAHPAFTDGRYQGVVIWMDREDAIDLYPGCEDILSSTFDVGRSDTFGDRPQMHWCDTKRRRVRVVQIWWKRKRDWWTSTFTRGGFLDPPVKSPYTDRHGDATCSLILRSCYVDRELNRYGIVRDLISPQDGVNKRESKLLHMLNVNQVIMEAGAVDDVDKVRQEAAKPDGVMVVNRGFEFKLQKDQAEIQGHFHMLEYAVGQMNVTGPNAAMQGKDPREQSGRAIIAQQSGGQMEHEPIADTLRQWSHKIYEAMWMRARQFWTAQKSIRVTDEEKKVQFITLNRPITLMEELQGMPPEQAQQIARQMGLQPGDPRLQQVVRVEHNLDDLDVDITVEEGPDSPTMAAEQFSAIMALPPLILQNFPPAFFIKASSLRNKDELLAMLEQHQQEQAQAAAEPKAIAKAKAEADVSKVTADAADKRAQAVERLHGMHQDHSGANAPPENALLDPQPAPAPLDPLAVDQQFHEQSMDRAKLGLAAQQQGHDQAMDVAGHGLAVRQAMQPPPGAPAPPAGA